MRNSKTNIFFYYLLCGRIWIQCSSCCDFIVQNTFLICPKNIYSHKKEWDEFLFKLLFSHIHIKTRQACIHTHTNTTHTICCVHLHVLFTNYPACHHLVLTGTTALYSWEKAYACHTWLAVRFSQLSTVWACFWWIMGNSWHGQRSIICPFILSLHPSVSISHRPLFIISRRTSFFACSTVCLVLSFLYTFLCFISLFMMSAQKQKETRQRARCTIM